MCGICGFIDYARTLDQGDRIIVDRMSNKLFHRGPDAQQSLLVDNVAFGFSRLSIIGLENGMQPIYNEDKTCLIICNGEIFNYIELREQLRKNGHVFQTDSDVEVLVHLYEECGIDFLNRLNGQFAFALYDLRKKTLFCVRDQMGIIPFFYTMADDTFIFGSEIKAILAHPSVQAEVDPVGLDQIMTFAGLISPRTMFKNIHSLENGHLLRVDANGRCTKEEYWDLIYPEISGFQDGKDEQFYIDELEGYFDNAVRLRLRSDVPSGFYLSGGLDSSMVAMKVHQFMPNADKDAFSIDFVDSSHSETVYQNMMARRSNATLHQKTFRSDDIAKRLQASIYHSECPVKETYNTASYYLSRKVREQGIKVILSGEGADEFFAGYIGYRFDKMRSENSMQNPVDPEEARLRYKLWGDENFFYEMNYLEYNRQKRKLYSDCLSGAFEEINCLNYPLINKSRIMNRNILDKRSYIDYKLRLTDHLISDHGDRMAMANSVEVRYPFLDKDLVEFSTRIPPGLKLKDFTEKYILKKLAGRFVPGSICDREKFGFVAPGSPYLLQHNVEYIYDVLSYDRIKRQGYFDPDQVEALKKRYREKGFSVNVPFETDLLLIIITFGIFLEHFFEH